MKQTVVFTNLNIMTVLTVTMTGAPGQTLPLTYVINLK